MTLNKVLAFAIALNVALAPAVAQFSQVPPFGAGQIPGTTTNDNAGAGKVGQFVNATTTNTGLGSTTSTITVTIASPAVVTWGATTPYASDPNGIATCASIYFTTTGALPTGITASTNYFVIGSSISGNTFQIATTCDNAITGTAINTSGTQSGVQTAFPGATLSTGAVVNLAGMALTAGDWDITGTVGFLTTASTSYTTLLGAINTTSASLTGSFHPGRATVAVAATVPGSSNSMLSLGTARFSLSATTTIYCVGVANFTLSTMDLWGACSARRVR